MTLAYKENIQFIIILVVMYIIGVWFGPVIYILFPIIILLFGLKEFSFELFIIALWILILSDYVPVRNATQDDLQFAKDLKFLIPLALFGFFVIHHKKFAPIPKFQFYFIPFFICAIIGLNYSLDITTGIQKTISYLLMYISIPVYVVHLHRIQGELFWKSLVTFLVGMLMIGIVLRFVAPQIALIEGGRFKSILGNPNGLGIFLNLTYILWMVVKIKGLAKFSVRANRIILFVLLISIIWCGSRNAMMSMVVFYLLYRIIKINWFLAIIFVGVFLTYNDLIFELFIGIIEFMGLQEYFRVDSIEKGSGRIIAWAFAWQEIQNYLFIGGGFGHDENIMRPNYHWLSRMGHQGGVHNSYISLWMDSGLIGLISYFIAFITIIFRAMKKNYLVIAFAVSILINITYESWLVASLNPYTILFLIILTIFAADLKPETSDLSNEVISELSTI